MKDINKIIDSLSSVEQNLMYNALQKRLNRGPEYTIRKNGTNLMINMRMPIMELYAVLFLKLLKWLI